MSEQFTNFSEKIFEILDDLKREILDDLKREILDDLKRAQKQCFEDLKHFQEQKFSNIYDTLTNISATLKQHSDTLNLHTGKLDEVVVAVGANPTPRQGKLSSMPPSPALH